MKIRYLLINEHVEECLSNRELPSKEDQKNAIVEILYDFLVVETMNEVRGLLLDEELKRLEIIRTLFAKILANTPTHEREHVLGSIYLAPAELVKIGLHKMLQYPEIELLHYAGKQDGGMLRVIAQYMWQRDYGKKDKVTTH
ncbi:MAG: hypothetical protein AAB795_00485 [Patescibacteria group bacterium]